MIGNGPRYELRLVLMVRKDCEYGTTRVALMVRRLIGLQGAPHSLNCGEMFGLTKPQGHCRQD